jgi:hypothetical protein
MSIGPGSRAAAALMLLSAAPSLAQTPTVCGRDMEDAFERLGTPKTQMSDWDDPGPDREDWTPQVRFRDFPMAGLPGRARASVASRRIEILLESSADYGELRERLVRQLPGIDCRSRTITWPSPPEPEADQDPEAEDYGPSFSVDGPEPETQEPRDVELGHCRWTAPAGRKEGLTSVVLIERYGWAMRDTGFPPFDRMRMDWPERTVEVECVLEGDLPYGWGWRWLEGGWLGLGG